MKHLPKAPTTRLRRIAASLAFAVVLAPATLAQGTKDLVGIYTEKDGTGVSHLTLTPGFPNLATAYVCLTGIDDPAGVSGWEFTLSGADPADGVIVTSWDLTWGQGSTFGPLNIATPPDFIVGLQKPIPHSADICVLSFTFFVTDAAPKAFFIHPTAWPSVPGFGAYVGGTSAGALYPLMWAYGGEPYVAFTVNSVGDCTPRSGILGTNPAGLDCTNAPYAGTPWMATIDTTPTVGSSSLSTLLVVGFGGPLEGVPLLGYELLCVPPYLMDPSFGEHHLPVPAGTTGLNFTTQGARIELDPLGNIVVVLLNAVDITIG